MKRDDLERIRKIHDDKGLCLNTASGLSGTISDGNGSVTAPVTILLDECEKSLKKDAEITSLRAQLADARAKAPVWQTMETAPRDGSEVYISGAYPNGQQYVEVSFFWPLKGHWNGRKIDPPSHWMPKPCPPLASLKEGE